MSLTLARQALDLLSYTSPALSVLVTFEIGFLFMPRTAWTAILLSVLPHTAGKTGTCHHNQPLVDMGVLLFAQVGLEL
jgi:hypothetical protein